MGSGLTTGMLQNAPAPSYVFYQIVGKIPSMFDVVKDALNEPIVWGMLILLVVCLFIFSLHK